MIVVLQIVTLVGGLCSPVRIVASFILEGKGTVVERSGGVFSLLSVGNAIYVMKIEGSGGLRENNNLNGLFCHAVFLSVVCVRE